MAAVAPTDAGYLEADETERTVKFSQHKILPNIDINAANLRMDLD